MKVLLAKILYIIVTPIYFTALALSNIFKLKGREDMPTVKEWISDFNHIKNDPKYGIIIEY